MEASPRQLARALKEVAKTSDKERLSVILRNFTKTLYQQGLLNMADLVINYYEKFVDEENQVSSFSIVSARELEQKEIELIKEELEKMAEGRRVELILSVDPVLIAGLVVKHGDKVLDMSLAGRLKEFERGMIL